MLKLMCLFPGQGSQYVGMGKELYDEFPVSKACFEEASDVLGINMADLCFHTTETELARTQNAQVAILAVSVAAYRVLHDLYNVQPFMSAGHSLGEITALCCAESISFSDALKLVRARGTFMERAIEVDVGAMAAVSGIAEEEILNACEHVSAGGLDVTVSNYNSPDQIVISGHAQALSQVEEILRKDGARITRLKVRYPFHCKLMQPASDNMTQELALYNFLCPRYVVLSNVDAKPHRGGAAMAEVLSRQIVMPVKWMNIMQYAKKCHIDAYLEIGPKTILSNLVIKNGVAEFIKSIEKPKDFHDLIHQMPDMDQAKWGDNQAILKFIARSLAIVICTRNLNWDNDAYEEGVLKPYRKIQSMYRDLESGKRRPEEQDIEAALGMLHSVFSTKKVSPEEQKQRYLQLFQESGYSNQSLLDQCERMIS